MPDYFGMRPTRHPIIQTKVVLITQESQIRREQPYASGNQGMTQILTLKTAR